MSQLTDEQKEHFDAITSGEYANFVLMSGKFQGLDAAYICAASEEDAEGAVTFRPVAIIVDTAFLDRFDQEMLDPNGTPLKAG